ncbi:hypothetical protein KBB96_09240 [Luteolibacter ambystomatis]|uniref:Uncharacterized protein n=2 Tax=Luteolibacter ambystomatis TaxID=2824561 RepID=A0A975J2X4_9BACT|nr:hypothetical protein [Luteolibacter ambystomatis]QUE53062.1 hypothetical protein KBB96_09240 [Luteolibacter ambystomatis]
MILPACIFTYAGGALVLPWTVRGALRAGLVPVVCEDAASPLPGHVRGWLMHEGIDLVTTTFPRRGNLNGTDCAAGICRTLAETALRYGATHVLKLDDDTVVMDRRVFTRHRHARAVGLTWPDGRPGPTAWPICSGPMSPRMRLRASIVHRYDLARRRTSRSGKPFRAKGG